MSVRIMVPDTHVRRLSDAVLADRLTRDLLTGLTASTRYARVGGYEVAMTRCNAQGREPEWAYPLRHRDPAASTVTRHTDGSIDVQLITDVSVHFYPAGAR